MPQVVIAISEQILNLTVVGIRSVDQLKDIGRRLVVATGNELSGRSDLVRAGLFDSVLLLAFKRRDSLLRADTRSNKQQKNQ
jgi:hypothetical protein